MSRMLCYLSSEPLPLADAVGDAVLAEFAGLARLHADGWGTAWRDAQTGEIRVAGSATTPAGGEEWTRAMEPASTSRLLYLRFASRGAPPAAENVQPFLRGGAAFQHNGLIAPRADLLGLLPTEEESALRGTTDSEAYFAAVRSTARPVQGFPGASTVAAAVAGVRARFTDACLNAMLLTDSTLMIVHAAGTRGAPLAAFADRGFDADGLPPGHGDGYDVLRSTVSARGARVIATTGIDQESWTRLDDETVFSVSPGGLAPTRMPARGARHP